MHGCGPVGGSGLHLKLFRSPRLTMAPVPMTAMITSVHGVLNEPLLPWQVYLATLPRGATFRQLCVYVHTLCHGPGTVAANDQTIDQLVGAALHLAPGKCHW